MKYAVRRRSGLNRISKARRELVWSSSETGENGSVSCECGFLLDSESAMLCEVCEVSPIMLLPLLVSDKLAEIRHVLAPNAIAPSVQVTTHSRCQLFTPKYSSSVLPGYLKSTLSLNHLYKTSVSTPFRELILILQS